MKKILSISLSVLMIALLFVPAFAADRTVTFVQPGQAILEESRNFKAFEDEGYAYFREHPYVFAKVEDGAVQFEEDPSGPYVYYSSRYMTLDDIYESYWDRVPPERYVPATYAETESFADGDDLTFAVFTNPAYNAASVTVFVNSVRLDPAADGLYRIKVDRNLTIRVLEDDENGTYGLQKNLFNVAMTSDKGYNVKSLSGQSYRAAFFGGDFNFRVKVKKGYSAASMKVAVVRGVSEKDFMGEFDAVGNILNRNEILISNGVDAEGCRLYTIRNVTSDCRIVISGVREDKKADILTTILKILRQILDFLGIKISFVEAMTNEYKVSVDNQAAGVTYAFLSGGELNADGTLSVMNGSGVTLQVIKSAEDQEVTVEWSSGDSQDEDFSYSTVWTGKRDPSTGETVFIANYNVDAITADTVITIR